MVSENIFIAPSKFIVLFRTQTGFFLSRLLSSNKPSTHWWCYIICVHKYWTIFKTLPFFLFRTVCRPWRRNHLPSAVHSKGLQILEVNPSECEIKSQDVSECEITSYSYEKSSKIYKPWYLSVLVSDTSLILLVFCLVPVRTMTNSVGGRRGWSDRSCLMEASREGQIHGYHDDGRITWRSVSSRGELCGHALLCFADTA